MKSSFLAETYVKVDESQMAEGSKVDFGRGFFVTVRHVGSPKVQGARARITQQLKIGNRNRELTPEQQKEITAYTVAHGGIVGWEGGGSPTFTPEVAMEIFKERPEFLEDVTVAMTSYETFREEEIDSTVGNSSKSSSGDSSLGNTSKASSSTKAEE